MKVELMPVDQVIPYARNPRINAHAIEKVAASIKEFGFRQPIVTDKEMVIVVGHVRFEAAKRLGLKKVPVHIATELTPEQIKAYRITDNRVGEESEWDKALLQLEIAELDDATYDTELLGFNAEELKEIQSSLDSMEDGFGEDDDDDIEEADTTARIAAYAEQVKNRMRARMMSGYWIMKAPRGYKMQKRPGHGKVMVRDEPVASIIQEGLEGFALDRFSSPVELQAFFEYQPDFPRDRKGRVHIQRVLDLLNNMLYTGYYEYPQWDIALMKGKHDPIISFETYTRIQDKLHGRAKAPARKDLNQDFVLRGFLLCDCCGQPMTSCWSKGAYGRYPYYLCHTPGCALYGKSIKRDKAEEDFAELLKKLTPANGTIDLMLQLIEEAKEARLGNFQAIAENLRREKQLIEQKIEQLVDRIVAANSSIIISTYERQIKQLEERRIVIDEKIKKCGKVDENFGKVSRTFLKFLQKPHEYWASADLMKKRTVLKATFARPLAYHRKEGYRTPALSLPFSVLRDFSDSKSGLVEHNGVEPLTSSMPWKRSTS